MLSVYMALIEDEVDQVTFEYIYYSYRNQMHQVAKRFLGTWEDAEDAVQEALIRIAKSIRLIPTEDKRKQKAYVMTVVKNVALAMLNKQSKEGVHTELPKAMFDAGADPFERLQKSQDYESLLEAIHSLPLTYREVLMMRYVFDLPTQHIAKLLGRKPSTVKQQITRGKNKLASIYKGRN